MRKFTIGSIIVGIFAAGFTSSADAHPHATIDLMETHSHTPHDANFQVDFIMHTFEQVIISLELIKNLLFG